MRSSIAIATLLVLTACGSSADVDGGVDDYRGGVDAMYDFGALDLGPGHDAGPGDAGPLPSSCGALPAPTGTVVHVDTSQADDLPSIVHDAASGTTILLADGTYRSTQSGESARRIQFLNSGVTFRGESGDST